MKIRLEGIPSFCSVAHFTLTSLMSEISGFPQTARILVYLSRSSHITRITMCPHCYDHVALVVCFFDLEHPQVKLASTTVVVVLLRDRDAMLNELFVSRMTGLLYVGKVSFAELK